MSRIKLVALDLDGTLLKDDKSICPYNIEVLTRAIQAGIKVVLCSGRSVQGMQRDLGRLGLIIPGQYAVALNGGNVFETDTRKSLFHMKMDNQKSRFMIEEGRKRVEKANIQMYTVSGAYVERWDDTTEYYRKATASDPVLVDDLMTEADNVVKIAYFARGPFDMSLKKILALKADFETVLPQGLTAVITAPYLVEVYDEKMNKGVGLSFLTDYLGMKRDEVMAVGDLENDLSMLEYAGLSVAMANGSETVKKSADWVTTLTNNEGGVGEAVEKFVL